MNQKHNNGIQKYPHPRSLEGIKTLAMYRGMMGGHEFAEAFELIRKIN